MPALQEARLGGPAGLLPDPSFRALLGELAWRRLPVEVRQRFAHKPAPGAEIIYDGIMLEVRASWAGRLMAQACRLVGTPLAPYRGKDVPVTVRLTLDQDGTGIVWERVYRFPGRAPLSCVSIKKASPGNGLIECVGAGVGMYLKLSESRGELHFRSAGYFWRWRGWHAALPRWLGPGSMHVVHSDLGAGRFRFRIAVLHPLLGETFYQDGVFAARRAQGGG